MKLNGIVSIMLLLILTGVICCLFSFVAINDEVVCCGGCGVSFGKLERISNGTANLIIL
jgi:hypothetical protein